MNEQERVAFYEAHKDDPSLWKRESWPDPPRARGTLSATITVRFTPEEADLIRRAAQARGASYSDVIREAVRTLRQPACVEPGYQFTTSIPHQLPFASKSMEDGQDQKSGMKQTWDWDWTPSGPGRVAA